jgi:thiol:disulfide interchange protein DsbA
MSQLSGITGVPAMIVNGKYISDAPMAGGQPKLLEVVDFLVQKESE